MTKVAMTAAADITEPTLEEVVAQISRKKPAPAGADAGTLRAAVASVLARGGKALGCQSTRPEKVVATLSMLEELAGLSGKAVVPWLMLRALGLPAGAQVGVTADRLADPIFTTLLSASNLIATTDPDATVRGLVDEVDARDLSTLSAQARIVKLDPAGAIVTATASGTVFTAPVADAAAAVAIIDAHGVKSAPAKASLIGPLSFNTLDAARPSAFAASMFATYHVRRIEIPGACSHPTDLVESSALASVMPPEPSYQPHFHPEIISKGVLSDVQLETVIYAGEAHSSYLPAHPDDPKKTAPRQGFLAGHGTGVGKGRITAAIIADNWAQGRRRHLWFSERAHLIEDARRDWVALGGRAEDVIDIRDLPSEGAFAPFNGILFSTYASLRTESATSTRVRQIIDWFGAGEDGVVAFDEAQNLRNSRDPNGRSFFTHVSDQGRAALELQDALPNARVTYVSATSASDIASMGFAVRLGLWGPFTAFPTATRFFSAMDEGGINALEMVARDLKAMGLYLAANLSFEGVKYERLNRVLTTEERDVQDRLADIWLRVHDGLKRSKVTTGRSGLPTKISGRFHSLGDVHFMMARARFFQALMASLNTPQMIEAIRDDMAAGHSAIIQMTNTFAANAERAIEEAEASGASIDSVEATPRDILLGYVERQFPIYKVHAVRRGKKYYAENVLDAQGKPIECPKAVAIRDQLAQEIKAIAVPEGPLEQILKAFGPDMVSEITGRSRRLVPAGHNGQRLEDRTAADVADDLSAFMNDAKRILVFSSAGGTGGTYSAQRTCRNQRLRRHYVLQPGWRADIALQGMGRSHRSNQAQPPEYILLSNDLWASQRMVSAVAKGMRDLGALTRGLRQAASQDFFTQDEDLESDYAQEAWVNFVISLNAGRVPGLSIGQFEREACISLRNGRTLMKKLPPVRRFLNAMSAMKCDHQALFGQHFRAELQTLKVSAVESGELDRGIETITPDSLIKLQDEVIYRDPRTGGETRLLKMLRIDELEPTSYTDARQRALRRGSFRVVKSLLTDRIAIMSFPKTQRGMLPSPQDKVEVMTPTGSRIRTREEVYQEPWMLVDATVVEQLWNAEMAERGTEDELEFWVVSGAMLPIWDKLPRNRPKVFRMETDEGEQVIGRMVGSDFVDKLLKRVDAMSGGGLGIDEVEEALAKDGVVSLANGWVIQGRTSRITGQFTITLSMPLEDETPYAPLIQSVGLKSWVGPLRNLAYYRVPSDDAERVKAIKAILAQTPAVSVAVL